MSARFILAVILHLLILVKSVPAIEVNGHLGISGLLYQQQGRYANQHSEQFSVLAEIEMYHSWNNNLDSITFKPYARLDQYDNERSHFDIRELLWLHVGTDWEFRAGMGKVFWGVNEANHLVDIINQDDQVDDISGDPKLGQTMLNWTLIKDWGTVDFFLLPGFRERTFPGAEGRLRPAMPIAVNQAEYESTAKEQHIDVALRWGHTFGDYDLGLHYFRGTNRDPLIKIQENQQGKLQLIPYYQQIDQVGVDFQATLGGWLWKLETIIRQSKNDKFTAVSGGYEYTFVGIMDSSMDLGIISEYSWDERGQMNLSQFQNDLMLGARLVFNDAQSTEILAGYIQDLDENELRNLQIEASRRLGDDWKINLELRLFSKHTDTLFYQDDHWQITLKKYF